MKVIICDDNKEFVNQIIGFFDKYDKENQELFLTFSFYDAETMFDFFK